MDYVNAVKNVLSEKDLDAVINYVKKLLLLYFKVVALLLLEDKV